jgi:acetolactate synthase I/II/III large subunit
MTPEMKLIMTWWLSKEIPQYGVRCQQNSVPSDPVSYAEAFGAQGLMIQSPDQISSVLKHAFNTPGPVLVGLRVDDRDSRKLFEQVDERSIL